MTTTLQPTQKDFDQMIQILTGYFVTQMAGALATYSIADHLAKGPATADEIATWTGVDPQATFRLLRACTSLGLVSHDGNKFAATPLLGTLQSDVPGSLNGLAIAFTSPAHWLLGVDLVRRYAQMRLRHFRPLELVPGSIIRNIRKNAQRSLARCTDLHPVLSKMLSV
jgi:Dimerisation domain